MKSKFALSFGISLMVVGLINVFIDTNNLILFGVSLSSFIFSIISILYQTILNEEKHEFICIIPIIILFVFLCYSTSLLNYEIFNKIMESNITNILTFMSFGLFFISEYITNKSNDRREQIKHQSIIIDSLKFLILIRRQLLKYREKICKNKILVDEESKKYIEYIEELCEEKSKFDNIKINLLDLDRDKFSLEEFSNAYIKEHKKLECISNEKEK